MPSRRQQITRTEAPFGVDAGPVGPISYRDKHRTNHFYGVDGSAPTGTFQEHAERKEHRKSRKHPQAGQQLAPPEDTIHLSPPHFPVEQPRVTNSNALNSAFEKQNHRAKRIRRQEGGARHGSGKGPRIDMRATMLGLPYPEPTLARRSLDHHSTSNLQSFPHMHNIPIVAHRDATWPMQQPRKARTRDRVQIGMEVEMDGYQPDHNGVLSDPVRSNRATWASSAAFDRHLHIAPQNSYGTPTVRDQTQRRGTSRYGLGNAVIEPPTVQPLEERSISPRRHPSIQDSSHGPHIRTRRSAEGVDRSINSYAPESRQVGRTVHWWKALGHKMQSLRTRVPAVFKLKRSSPVVPRRIRSKLRRKPRVRSAQRNTTGSSDEYVPLPTVGTLSTRIQRPDAPSDIQRRMSWLKQTASGSKFIEAL